MQILVSIRIVSELLVLDAIFDVHFVERDMLNPSVWMYAVESSAEAPDIFLNTIQLHKVGRTVGCGLVGVGVGIHGLWFVSNEVRVDILVRPN